MVQLTVFGWCSQLATRVPTRFVIGMMVFLATTFAYMLSFNFSINLLAMVHTYAPNGTQLQLPDFGPRYSWSAYQQSLLLGAYFYGNVVAVPAGLAVERFGQAKRIIIASFAICTVLAALCPQAADAPGFGGFEAMFAVRFAMGCAQGLLYPAYTKLISLWSPPGELGLFTSALMGSNIGTVLAWCVSGAVVEVAGWRWSFYVNAAIVAVFTASCCWLVYDEPAQHPRIAPAERTFIEKSLHAAAGAAGDGGSAAGGSRWPPLWRMASSAPCWALFVLQFGNSWGSFFLVTAAPKFMNEILGFEIGRTGLLASLPYVARTLVAFAVAFVAKRLEARFGEAVSTTCWRRVYSVLSHVLPGMLLLAIPYAGRHWDAYACVALITLSYGLNGAVTVVATTNYHDLSPNYATTLNALINGLGNSAGFLSPLVVAYYTQQRNTMAEWESIFAVGAAVYVLPALVFALWGSGEVQPWNDPVEEEETEAIGDEECGGAGDCKELRAFKVANGAGADASRSGGGGGGVDGLRPEKYTMFAPDR